LGPGPGEVGQGGLKVFHLWHYSQKTAPKPKKYFFIANYKTCWVFWAFDRVCSTYPAGEIPAKATCDPVVLAWAAWFRPASKVLMHFAVSEGMLILAYSTDYASW